MIVEMDGDLKAKLSKDGSHLKYTRTKGGAGAGIMAVGGFFLAIGLIFGILLVMIDNMPAAALMIGIGIVLGGGILFLGFQMKKKMISSYMEYYKKNSGYTEQELIDFDREFMNGKTLFLNPNKKIDDNAKLVGGILTDHWMKLPYMISVKYSGLFRVSDIAVACYLIKPVVEGYRHKNNKLLIVSKMGDDGVFNLNNEEVGNKIVEEITRRNPKVITVRNFSYNGVNYDVIHQPKEVARLYSEICGEE